MPRKTRKYKTNPQTTPRGHAFSGGRQVAFWIDSLLGRRKWAYLFFTMFKMQIAWPVGRRNMLSSLLDMAAALPCGANICRKHEMVEPVGIEPTT